MYMSSGAPLPRLPYLLAAYAATMEAPRTVQSSADRPSGELCYKCLLWVSNLTRRSVDRVVEPVQKRRRLKPLSEYYKRHVNLSLLERPTLSERCMRVQLTPVKECPTEDAIPRPLTSTQPEESAPHIDLAAVALERKKRKRL
jgi:hypothetical protein